jgi:hypothetical protein
MIPIHGVILSYFSGTMSWITIQTRADAQGLDIEIAGIAIKQKAKTKYKECRTLNFTARRACF